VTDSRLLDLWAFRGGKLRFLALRGIRFDFRFGFAWKIGFRRRRNPVRSGREGGVVWPTFRGRRHNPIVCPTFPRGAEFEERIEGADELAFVGCFVAMEQVEHAGVVGEALEGRGGAVCAGRRTLAADFQVEVTFWMPRTGPWRQRAMVMFSTKADSAAVRGWNSAMREAWSLSKRSLDSASRTMGLSQEAVADAVLGGNGLAFLVTGPRDLAPLARAESGLRWDLMRRQHSAGYLESARVVRDVLEGRGEDGTDER